MFPDDPISLFASDDESNHVDRPLSMRNLTSSAFYVECEETQDTTVVLQDCRKALVNKLDEVCA